MQCLKLGILNCRGRGLVLRVERSEVRNQPFKIEVDRDNLKSQF